MLDRKTRVTQKTRRYNKGILKRHPEVGGLQARLLAATGRAPSPAPRIPPMPRSPATWKGSQSEQLAHQIQVARMKARASQAPETQADPTIRINATPAAEVSAAIEAGFAKIDETLRQALNLGPDPKAQVAELERRIAELQHEVGELRATNQMMADEVRQILEGAGEERESPEGDGSAAEDEPAPIVTDDPGVQPPAE